MPPPDLSAERRTLKEFNDVVPMLWRHGAMTVSAQRGQKTDYLRFVHITTRWMDNDVYQHVNNVVYYSFFDSAVNRLLIDAGLLDITRSSTIGLVVETSCRYFSPLAFPDEVAAGVRVAHIGTSSVRYEIGLFRNGETIASAEGYFIHVNVDRESRKPSPLADDMRRFLSSIAITGQP
jgi:acyl-CoA thioester hydrolase